MVTVTSIKRVSAAELADMIRAEPGAADQRSFAIVDVRDDDHIGGHILGSINCPSQLFSTTSGGLVQRLRNKKKVVFHCALSQQRGPSAALKYARAREAAAAKANEDAERAEEAESTVSLASESEHGSARKPMWPSQDVYVLDKGFVGWQEVFGEDVDLTEGYRKELWKDEGNF
jgi:rhodanese-related sulfurtransferase